MTARGRKRRGTSERPADLNAERESFVRTFMHKGVELTEDLIRENEQLRADAKQLARDNARLRTQLASNDAIRELLQTIERLEGERNSLLSHSDELERVARQNEARHRAAEQELNDLASLYVASFQLSATLSVRRVVRDILELLEQLVGARSFVLYIVPEAGKPAIPIAARGIDPKHLVPVSTEDGPIGHVCLTGVARVLDPDVRARGGAEPLAVLPLSFESEVVAVIAVHELLPHKTAWARVDHELFRLLGAHGATALIAANLYEREAGPRAALADLPQRAAKAAGG